MRKSSLPALVIIAGALALWWALLAQFESDDAQETDRPTVTAPEPDLPHLAGRDIHESANPTEPPAEPGTVLWLATGRVLDAAGGPVPGARVGGTLRRGSAVDVLAGVHCDHRGVYQLDLGIATTWGKLGRAVAILSLSAEADGHGRSPLHELPLSKYRLGEEVVVDFRLEAGSRVEGRVTDLAGVPLPDASVALEGDSEEFDAMASTDVNGHYSLGVRHGGRIRIVISWGEHEVSAGPFDIGTGVVEQIPDVLLPVAVPYVHGITQRADGTPAPRVTVFGRSDKPPVDFEGTVSATSDEAGEFQIDPTRHGQIPPMAGSARRGCWRRLRCWGPRCSRASAGLQVERARHYS